MRGDTSLGTLMMALVNEIGACARARARASCARANNAPLAADETRDWSDHALWWPDNRKWLKHTRSTLDQTGVTATTYLEFTPMHKPTRCAHFRASLALRRRA